ncbi:MAG: hypothetical protein ACK54Z_04705 [Cyanobacteriota bacterium]|jgi:hypothetical protein
MFSSGFEIGENSEVLRICAMAFPREIAETTKTAAGDQGVFPCFPSPYYDWFSFLRNKPF